ncbi:TPA: hypothetical protein ACX6RX_003235 [Photobacterium damselae]
MISNVELPSKVDLKDLIDEALENGAINNDVFVENHCAGLITVLSENPLAYRAYGAYWWPVKKILNSLGYGEFVGSSNEEVTAAKFFIEDDVTTLCAAWYYQQSIIDTGNMNSNIHIYTDSITDEQFEYSIDDIDMEKYRVGI